MLVSGQVFGERAVRRLACGGSVLVLASLLQAVPGMAQTSIDGGTTVTVPGSQSSPWDIGNLLTVGSTGTGTLQVGAGGTVTATQVVAGGQTAANGTITVSGAGTKISTTSSSGGVIVGDSGTGSVSLSNGGTIETNAIAIASQSGSTGTLAVTGATSSVTAGARALVGLGGSGVLTIGGAGRLNSVGGSIGEASSAVGQATITGAGSRWDAVDSGSTFLIGDSGNGSLSVLSGGAFATSSVSLGRNATGVANTTVDGTGSSWTNNGVFNLAGAGTAGLTVSGGATLVTPELTASSNGGAATITVTGTGSTLTASTLVSLGLAGQTTMTVSNGGALSTGRIEAGGAGSGTLSLLSGGTATTEVAVLGAGATGSGALTVDGTGSSLMVTNGVGRLFVGAQGAGTLTVSNGGGVSTKVTVIGNRAGVTGQVMLSGTGSTLTATEDFQVAGLGNGTLSVASGAALSTGIAHVGGNADTEGSVTLSGTGSTWTASNRVTVGGGGMGTVRVENGGALSTAASQVGVNAGSSGTVIVTGPGSSWTDATDIVMGGSGTAQLTVVAGGSVSGRNLRFALNADGTGNLLVDGTGSTVTMTDVLALGRTGGSTGTVSNGGRIDAEFIEVGGNGSADLTIASGGSAHGRSLTIGVSAGSSGTVTVTGAGSSIALDGTPNIPEAAVGVIVGNAGTGALNILAGAEVSTELLSIAALAGGAGTVSVSGTGSRLTTRDDLTVGLGGEGMLAVSASGVVTAMQSVGFGFDTMGVGHLTLAGTGSQLNVARTLYFGQSHDGDGLVSGGGAISAQELRIADADGTTGSLTLSDAGTTLTVAGATIIGNHGTAALTVQGGAAATSGGVAMGGTADSVSTLTVTGAGTSLTSGGTLYAAAAGQSTVMVSAGGHVAVDRLDSSGTTSSAATIIVRDAGTSVTAANAINLATLGSASLAVSDGASVHGDSASLGTIAGSTATLTVAGPGSVFGVDQAFAVAADGQASVTVSAGGLLETGGAAVGASQAPGNTPAVDGLGTVIVTGAGSRWTNDTDLFVGAFGAGWVSILNQASFVTDRIFIGTEQTGDGRLTIAGGGTVTADQSAIGNIAGATASATVDGIGSLWTSPTLKVGLDGAGSLTVTNGGRVTSDRLGIGEGAVSGTVMNPTSNGLVTVTGAGSIIATTDLAIGTTGTGALVVADGGTVSGEAAVLGDIGTGSVRVTGTGSLWSTSVSAVVGEIGRATLTVENGGKATSRLFNIGALEGAEGIATVSGGTIESESLFVGLVGVGSLTLSDGAQATNEIVRIGDEVGGTGSVTVSGEGTRWTLNGSHTYVNFSAVGRKGTGTLTIDSGADVTSGGLFIGHLDGSQGTVIVTGAGSTLQTANDLAIGSLGNGVLEVRDGADVNAANRDGGLSRIVVGNPSTSATSQSGRILVTGAGSTLRAGSASPIFNGTIRVEDGGAALMRGTFVGDGGGGNIPGRGAVTVTGAGSRWTDLQINIGGRGTGTFDILAGATAESRELFIGSFGAGTMTVRDAGSRLKINDTILLNESTASTGPAIVAAASGGAVLVGEGEYIANAVNVGVGGHLAGFGTVDADLFVNGGTLGGPIPGNDGSFPIRLTTGSLFLDAGSVIDVALGAPSTSPVFNVLRDLTLDGTLNVTATTGFGTGNYRLMNYGGALVDNGLVIGTAPVGYNPGNWAINTDVRGEVTLLVRPGANEQYWDGPNLTPGMAAGGRGGTSMWDSTRTNWTNGDGSINAAWAAQGAVFSKDSTVTTSGVQTVTGLRVIADANVTIGGDGLSVGAGGATVRLSAPTPVTDFIDIILGVTHTTTLGVSAPISGAGGLTLIGDGGTMTLSGANSFTGGVTVRGAELVATANGALGTGAAVVEAGTLAFQGASAGTTGISVQRAGTLDFRAGSSAGQGSIANSGTIRFTGAASAGARTITNASGSSISLGALASANDATIVNAAGARVAFADPVTAETAGTVHVGSLSGAGAISIGSGSVALGGLNRSETIGGAITGTAGALIKEGTGTLTLSGANSFAGATTVSAGGLRVDGALGGAVTVQSGATLGGGGSIGGAVVVNDGAMLTGRSGQTLSMASLNLGAGSAVSVGLGTPSAGRLFAVAGNLTLDGSLTVSDIGGFGGGVYRLIDYGGTLTDNGLDLVSAPTVDGSLEVQTAAAGQVNLVVAVNGIPNVQFWNGATTTANGAIAGGSGTWTATRTPTNWTSANGLRADAWNSGFAIFQGASGTVSISGSEGAVAAQGLQFAVDGYRVQGDPLALSDVSGSSSIRVGDGSVGGAAMTATIASVLTGNALVKNDLGTLVLTGANSYAGGTTVAAGTLRLAGAGVLPGDAAVATGATLTFARDGSSSYAGRLSGGGDVRFASSGTTSLSGDSDAFAGGAFVDAGTLLVTGRLGGMTTVGSAARLGGTGTLGAIAVGNGGTLAPGASIGTLSAVSLSFAPGSIFEVEVDAAGNSDRVTMTGTAALAGTLRILAATQSYGTATDYTLLSAAGGVSGTFDNVTSNLALLTPSLAYGANSVLLTLTRNQNAFPDVADTPNARSAAGAIEALGSGATLYDRVVELDAPGARSAFRQLNGEVHAALRTAMAEDSRYVRDAVTGRLRTAFAEGGIGGTWAQFIGAWAKNRGEGNGSAAARDTQGLLVGLDLAVTDRLRAGLAGGYSRTSVAIPLLGDRGRIDGWHGSAYAGLQAGNLAISLGAAMTWNDLRTDRTIEIGSLSGRPSADYRATVGQIFGEAGYRIAVGSATLQPFVGLAGVQVTSRAFTETGGGSTGLSGERVRQSFGFSTLGARTVVGFDLGKAKAAFRGSLGWRHALGNALPQSVLSFEGSRAFVVNGTPLARDAAAVEAGVDVDLGGNAVVGIRYDGMIGEGAQDKGLRVTLGWRF